MCNTHGHVTRYQPIRSNQDSKEPAGPPGTRFLLGFQLEAGSGTRFLLGFQSGGRQGRFLLGLQLEGRFLLGFRLEERFLLGFQLGGQELDFCQDFN